MKNKVTIYGIHTIAIILEKYPQTIEQLFFVSGTSNKRVKALIDKAEEHGIQINAVAAKDLDGKLIGLLCRHRPALTEQDLLDIVEQNQYLTIAVLDEVTDVHNLGSILRSAAALGIAAVIGSKHHSAPLNDVARRVASGGAELVPYISVTNVARFLRLLKQQNFWIYACDAKSSLGLAEVEFAPKSCIVLGNEHRGVRRIVQAECDHHVAIKLSNNMESLNVAVTAGIFFQQINTQK